MDSGDVDPEDNTKTNSSDNSAKIVKTSSALQDMKDFMLSKYSSVFKEDLGPDDRIIGTQRVEMDDNGTKPLHFSTPKSIPAHLRKAADKELARCLAAGTL